MRACEAFDNDQTLLLMPAETRLPDSSIWDHASITAALSGALAGFNLTPEDVERWSANESQKELPHLVSFTFTPIQELIKASRKNAGLLGGVMDFALPLGPSVLGISVAVWTR